MLRIPVSVLVLMAGEALLLPLLMVCMRAVVLWLLAIGCRPVDAVLRIPVSVLVLTARGALLSPSLMVYMRAV